MSFREINVLYDNGLNVQHVGQLASSGAITVFEYDDAWMKRGLELAPFKLPVSARSHTFKPSNMASSTFGLFADSLPDGWGMLIMDRSFKKRGIEKRDITPLDQLAFLGNHAMGALCYRPPSQEDAYAIEAVSIGDMAREAFKLYEGRIEDAGRLLALIGGSPGGARPKALIGISESNDRFVSGTSRLPEGFSHWLVKFTGEKDKYDGILEFIYNKMAYNAGITVPDHILINDDKGGRHIATRRFDRLSGNMRRHTATVSGLLHVSHMAPTLDYEELFKLAWRLTASAPQVEEQFRRAAFNMFAVNRDDHSKNHGYVMSDEGLWELAPAYDLTYSTGPGGEHWTSYGGEGRNPGMANLLSIAAKSSISGKSALEIIEQVKTSVAAFKQLAKEYGVPAKISAPIIRHIETMLTNK